MIEVILLQSIAHLGTLGEVVRVRPGYARNYLIPKGQALPATRQCRARFEAQREQLACAQAELQARAQERVASLVSQGPIIISAKVGAEGKLFGAISHRDVVQACEQAGVSVEKREIHLPEKYLKHVGDYILRFRPVNGADASVECEFTLRILGQQAEFN